MNYTIIKNAISQDVCKILAVQYELQEAACKIMYPGQDMSDLSPNSFARYSPLCFEALSVFIQPLVEKTVGFNLYPVYSYARIYYNNSKLDKHFDRPSSEVSVSVCIEKDAVDWPLYIKTNDSAEHAISLNVGDIVIYSGRAQEHWRLPFEGTKQIQCFLQYVAAEGEYSWLKWDTRPALGLPFEYAEPNVRHEMQQIIERDSKSQ